MIYYDSQARSSNFIGLVKIEDMQMHAMQSWGPSCRSFGCWLWQQYSCFHVAQLLLQMRKIKYLDIVRTATWKNSEILIQLFWSGFEGHMPSTSINQGYPLSLSHTITNHYLLLMPQFVGANNRSQDNAVVFFWIPLFGVDADDCLVQRRNQ